MIEHGGAVTRQVLAPRMTILSAFVRQRLLQRLRLIPRRMAFGWIGSTTTSGDVVMPVILTTDEERDVWMQRKP